MTKKTRRATKGDQGLGTEDWGLLLKDLACIFHSKIMNNNLVPYSPIPDPQPLSSLRDKFRGELKNE
jgi:hypothetical protein